MKTPSTFLLPILPIGFASAFVVPHSHNERLSPLSMSNDEWGTVKMEVKNLGSSKPEVTTPPSKQLPKMSQSIPFMERPKFLDGTMAGDVGFDPLKFADNKSNLMFYREAEIKHARLAMLAAAGWPLSELLDKPIASLFGMTPILDEANRVPSVLNGGMGKVSPAYWALCILFAGALDAYALAFSPSNNGDKADSSVPGNLGFDPLGLFPKKEKDQKWMQTAEIKNGRLAMIAITGFAFQEFVTHVAVVDQTPFFFQPIWDTLHDLTPQYIIPDTDTSTVLESVTTPPSDAGAASTLLESLTTPSGDTGAASTVLESITTPSGDTGAASTVFESITTPTPDEAIDSVATPPAPAVSSENAAEELAVAKQRIADLESKLAAISDISR